MKFPTWITSSAEITGTVVNRSQKYECRSGLIPTWVHSGLLKFLLTSATISASVEGTHVPSIVCITSFDAPFAMSRALVCLPKPNVTFLIRPTDPYPITSPAALGVLFSCIDTVKIPLRLKDGMSKRRPTGVPALISGLTLLRLFESRASYTWSYVAGLGGSSYG